MKTNVERQRKWYGKNRKKKVAQVDERWKKTKAFIDSIKQTKSCSHCGNSDVRCLDFHHRNPNEKEITIGAMGARHWGNDRILKEMEKCDVLCANCHRILHWEERHTLVAQLEERQSSKLEDVSSSLTKSTFGD